MAYYSFSEKIHNSESIPVFNQGELLRDFTYIDDVINECLVLMEKVPSSYEIYNIGNNHPESVNLLISYLEKYLNKKAVVSYLPMQEGDVKMTFANIDKLHDLTGYTPKVGLEEGIQLFIAWYIWYKENGHEN